MNETTKPESANAVAGRFKPFVMWRFFFNASKSNMRYGDRWYLLPTVTFNYQSCVYADRSIDNETFSVGVAFLCWHIWLFGVNDDKSNPKG